MTRFEKSQPNYVFVQAGKDSFAIGVHIMSNPYRQQPFKMLWEKGYRRAKSNYEQARLAAQRREALGEQAQPVPVPSAPASSPKTTAKSVYKSRPTGRATHTAVPVKSEEPATPAATAETVPPVPLPRPPLQRSPSAKLGKPIRTNWYRPGTIGAYVGGQISKETR